MAHGIVLAAGKATRVNGQFKPLLKVGGHRAIDWQRPWMPEDITVVGHSANSGLNTNTDYFSFDGGGGPVAALHAVIPHLPETDLIVAYADTLWFSPTPPKGGWFGVAHADGGRVWDIADEYGHAGRCEVPAGRRTTVCVGLYGFDDPEKLSWACEEAMDQSARLPEKECHMYRVINLMRLTPTRVDWVDVGDLPALELANKKLEGMRP